MSKPRAAKQPIWTDDALSRLLGARDGFLHSLVTVRATISLVDGPYSGRFHPRHVRKIAERDAITKPLRGLADSLEKSMRDCQEAYQREYARAHPPAELGGER